MLLFYECLLNSLHIKFVYVGYWVKVKVTGAENCVRVSSLQVVGLRLKCSLLFIYVNEYHYANELQVNMCH